MQLKRMYIRGLRCLESVDIDLAPGLNVFVGDNGAGKTSVLEAAFLLSHGRSFRSGNKDALTQRGQTRLELFAEVVRADAAPSSTRVGLGREGGRWQARLNGSDASLGELVLECPVVCFSPGSHALVSGAAEERRRYMDWGLFHVEQTFLPAWRRYQRALKQRNALLRSAQRDSRALYIPWEHELAHSGEIIDACRRRYVDALRDPLGDVATLLLPELGAVTLAYQQGWPDGQSLQDQLALSYERDLMRGHTRHGTHRADLLLTFEQVPGKEYFSRGQEKLAALCLYLAQCIHFRQCRGEWPVFCLDDLASELDISHQMALWSLLAGHQQQILVTGTSAPAGFETSEARMFHVEHGRVSASETPPPSGSSRL
ncbi:DNA replication/repair protein RecF [Frateuria aurantia]